MLFHIVKHELRLLFREPRFLIPFLLPPALLFFSQLFLAREAGKMPPEIAGFILLLLGVMAAPMAAPLTADSFAGERERKTLELLQMSPVSATTIFFGKFLAILPFPIVVAIASQWLFYALGGIPVDYVLKAMLGTISASLLLNGGALLISLKAKSVRSATQMSVVLSLPLFFAAQAGFRSYFANYALPVGILAASVFLLVICTAMSLKKFRSM